MEKQLGYITGILSGEIASNTRMIYGLHDRLNAQNRFNRKIAVLATLGTLYILKTEIRESNQRAQIKRLQREVETLKQSKEDFMKGE